MPTELVIDVTLFRSSAPRGALSRVWPVKCRWLRSVRSKMAVVLCLLLAVAGIQTGLTVYWIDNVAFLLERDETSRRQLDLYQRLSADINHYLMGRLDQRFFLYRDEQEHLARGIADHLGALEDSITEESDFMAAHSAHLDNSEEMARLQKIDAAVRSLVSLPGGKADADADWPMDYHTRLVPFLSAAMDAERSEASATMDRMRAMRRSLLRIGMICLGVPLLAALLVMIIVARSVLDPVAKLVAGVRRLGQGQPAPHVTLKRRDEFGLLAQHINHSARQIESHNRRLLRHNEALEHTVNERTQDLRVKISELKQVDDSRKRFFADVSHELRTPLTIISGEAQVALAYNEPEIEAYRSSLSAILANTGYLKRRIDDLLSIARAEDGKPSFSLRPVEPDRIAQDALTLCSGLAQANTVHLVFDGGCGGIVITGDESWLRQCFLTLLDNAIKFSRPGQTVGVTSRHTPKGIAVTVSDQGEGVPAEELPLLFERFYQTRSGSHRGGTGLGLSVARWIVEAHRGTISADSVQGAGTSIHMVFPLSDRGAEA